MAKTKVLIVEGKPGTPSPIADQLKRMGYSITGTGISAEEAFALIEAKQPHVILYFIDDAKQGIQFKADLESRFQLRCLLVASKKNQPPLKRAGLKEYIDYVGTPIEEGSLRASIEFTMYQSGPDSRQMEIISDLAADLMENQDINNLLNTILVQAHKLLDATYINIDLLDGKDSLITYAATDGLPLMMESKNYRGDGGMLSWQAIDTGQPAVIEDYSSWENRRRMFDELELKAVMVIPIIHRGHKIGVIDFSRAKTRKAFTAADIAAAQEFAQSIARILSNANLISRLQTALTRAADGKMPFDANVNSFRKIIDTSPEAITITDLDGNILLASKVTAALHGYETPEELLNRSVLDIVSPSDRKKIMEHSESLIKNGHTGTVEVTLLHQDGSTFPSELHTSIIRDENNTPQYVIGITHDISERKQRDLAQEHAIKREHDERVYAEALAEAILALSSHTGLNDILNELLVQAQRITPYKTANVMLMEDDTLRPMCWKGYEAYNADKFMAGLKLRLKEVPLNSEALHNRKPTIINDTKTQPGWKFLEEANWVRSCLIVPIVLQDRVLGQLAFDSEVPNTFTEEDIKRLKPLASAAASAIERVQLYESAQQELSERKWMESALSASEVRYRSLFETMPIALYRSTPLGQFIDCNPAMVELVGCQTREELLQLKVNDLWTHPEERINILDNLPATDVLNFEFEIRRADGTIIWAHNILRIMRSPQGQILYFDGSLRDITERKKAEKALQDSEAHFRAVVENSHDGIILLNAERRPIYVSPSYTRINGYSPEEWLGKYGPDYIHPDDQAITSQTFRDILQGPGRSKSCEYRLRHKQGHWFWVETTATNLLDDPHIHAIVLNSRDITERKKVEKERDLLVDRLQTILDNLPLGCVILDPDNHISYWNKTSEKVFGYTAVEVIGKHHYEVTVPESAREQVRSILQKTIQENKVTSGENENITKDGRTIICQWHNTPLWDSDGKFMGTLAISEDVTEKYKLENKIRENEAKLRAIFDTLAEGIALNEIIYDENGEMVDYRILDVNPAFYNIADYRGVDVVGSTATKLYGMPVDLIKNFWKTHKEKNDVAHTEMKSPISETYFYVSTSPFKDNKFVTSFFDITELKEMEAKLRLNQRAIESAAEGIIITDNTLPDNPVIFANQAFTAITGYTFVEAIGRNCRFLQGKDTDPQTTTQIRNAVAEKTYFEGDLLNYKKDGTPFWNHLRISPIFDENGNCTHFVGLQIDVTEKKKKEEAHNLAELRYTKLFEHSMDAILLADNNNHYVDVNPAACKLLGYSREEFLTLNASNVTAPEYLNKDDDLWHNFITYGRQAGEYALIHKNGTRIDVEYMAVANILPGLHLSVLHNITLRKKWGKDLQRHASYLSMLNEMTNSIFSAQDPEASIQIIAEGLTRIFRADGCYVTRWDDEQKLTIPLFSTIQTDPPYPEMTFLPNERTFTQALMESSKVIAIDQTDADILPYSNRIARMLPGKSLLGIPLFFGKNKFGAAIVAFTSSHLFSELEIEEAKQAGDQISLALWDVQQEQELKTQLKELDTLSKISIALSESERVGLQNVLQLIVDSARELIPGVEQAVIHLLDEEKKFLIPEALTGFASSEEGKRKMHLGEGVAGQAVATGQLINIPDVRFDSRFLPLNTQSKIRSLLVLPIVSSKDNLGTISVQSSTPNAFTEIHSKLLTELGTQAAIAIENAHLIENTQQALRETRALYQVIQGVATAFNPENVLQDTVELLQQNFGYHYVQVFVADPDTGDFIMRAGSGPIGAMLKEQGHYLVSGEGIVGYTAETGTPFFTNDVDESVPYKPHPLLPDTKSELAMPVKIGDEMLGLLDIHQVPPKHLTQRDVQLVSAVADQLAIALQKATLYEELQISLEQEKAIRNQLVQNERLAVMGRLLASVSHELNNPLQAIQNALFLLKEEKGISQQGRDDLSIVLAESERMADMIDRLRTTYRPTQAHEFRPTQINNLVRDVHALIATHLRHNNVAFEFEPDQNLPIIPALSDQLRQVVLNLMMNAVEAMTDGGTLKVSTQYLDGAEEILLTVSDTGPGIHESIMPYIFDAFITNKEHGTGLGLTITYDIITKHRGRIAAENNSDKGATFRIWLPLENREVI